MKTPLFSCSSGLRFQHIDAPIAVFPPRSALLRRATRQVRFAVVTLGMLASGCVGMPMAGPDSVQSPARNTRAAVPAPGTAVVIHDETMVAQITVMFGENYMAASGRRCAYYFEPGTDAVARKGPSGIACQAGFGDWTRIPPRIPVTPGP